MTTQAWLPRGAAAVACLTFDVDAETGILSADASAADHAMAITHQQFGPDVGVPRILGILGDLDVRATFFFPGWVAERRPDLVTRIAEAGHEIGHHSYSHVPASSMTRDQEERDFDRALEVFRRIGVPIHGHRAGLWEASWSTPAIIAERGLSYDSSLMGRDTPYRVATPKGSIVELPPHWSLDDWEQYAFLPFPEIGQHIKNPADVLSMWRAEVDAMRRFGGLFMLTNHPFLTGRPARAVALEQLIGHILDAGDVPILTAHELAAQLSEVVLPEHEHTRPELETGLFPTH
ncbi:polysaccharide deacetylase [Amycolatopsis acidicola]|uniref:Polysaccharide deacetylase n=1 Tax=Amycolatopsis acidicola TaxID=2596893 RepID=A0A5N0V282_9PSEU|nr:polysaccharide deacetylase [Amycolatopsis acidicola]KAA9160539.1 polysaccharide deacetylase [Amycolatopsis acidicola]